MERPQPVDSVLRPVRADPRVAHWQRQVELQAREPPEGLQRRLREWVGVLGDPPSPPDAWPMPLVGRGVHAGRDPDQSAASPQQVGDVEREVAGVRMLVMPTRVTIEAAPEKPGS
ncbi:hypothetical protein [Jiangella rhizosphaerae]|uniref:hypothetical protein n=1 Tax=Jiangella rhizosphaerae TaxID=2293569 RepID=UPI0011C40ECA|nr:hypothetical protein [Jiangella rhizosphaerae]